MSRGVDSLGKANIYIRHAEQVKMSPSEIADKVAYLVDKFDVGVLYVEVNQGGDLWKDVFKAVPAKYRSKSQSLSKQIRAGKALNFYQQGKVRHTAHFPVLEEQMWSFPKVSHEDVLDSVVSGILYFLDNKAVKLETKQINYLRRQHV